MKPVCQDGAKCLMCNGIDHAITSEWHRCCAGCEHRQRGASVRGDPGNRAGHLAVACPGILKNAVRGLNSAWPGIVMRSGG